MTMKFRVSWHVITCNLVVTDVSEERVASRNPAYGGSYVLAKKTAAIFQNAEREDDGFHRLYTASN
jgi:hypothetical protein